MKKSKSKSKDKFSSKGNSSNKVISSSNVTKQKSSEQSVSASQPMLTLKGHYVKQMTFQGPSVAQRIEGGTKTALTVNVSSIHLNADDHEVILSLKAEIESPNKNEKVAVINLIYGAQFQVKNMKADQKDAILRIEGPRLIFPYVQRIIADMTRDGNLTPLSLPAIDFSGLYQASKM